MFAAHCLFNRTFSWREQKRKYVFFKTAARFKNIHLNGPRLGPNISHVPGPLTSHCLLKGRIQIWIRVGTK
jgi:hypothetical protein